MKKIVFFITAVLFLSMAKGQDTLVFKNQYKAAAKGLTISMQGNTYETDKKGRFILPANAADTFTVTGTNYGVQHISKITADAEHIIYLHKNFSWTDLLLPMFYIAMGGLWFILFVVFAETGLFAGFFLPGDSLLFVAGIYSSELIQTAFGFHAGALGNLLILGILVSLAGIMGNTVGYWFGRKSGPFLFERKDTFFFKKKYLFQARDFYDKHGGGAIVIARFLPIIRTFAPIVAGIVGMEKKKFAYYNIIGCIAWVFAMLLAGHYLQQLFLKIFNFDLREHLEVIVVGIVLVTTAPILIKLFFGKSSSAKKNDQPVS